MPVFGVAPAGVAAGLLERADELPGGRERLERSIAVAEQAGLETEVGRAYVNLTAILIRRRDSELANHYLDPAVDY